MKISLRALRRLKTRLDEVPEQSPTLPWARPAPPPPYGGPQELEALDRRICASADELAVSLGRQATYEEIAAHAGVPGRSLSARKQRVGSAMRRRDAERNAKEARRGQCEARAVDARIRAAFDTLTVQLGRPPTYAQIAEQLGDDVPGRTAYARILRVGRAMRRNDDP